MCFQTLIAQLIDIKKITKTAGHEALLPSHSYSISSSREIRHFRTIRQTYDFRQLAAIFVILCDISVK